MKSLWTAYLSNGESINEQDLFKEGDILPFRKLVKYAVKNDLQINSVTLNINGVRYNSPSASDSGNFPSSIRPEKFWVMFKSRYLILQQEEFGFIGLSWLTDKVRTVLWVSLSSNISWIQNYIVNENDATEKLINETYSKENV